MDSPLDSAMFGSQEVELGPMHLAGTIGQTADAIVITDSSGKIQYVNAAFTAMTGYTSREVIGQNPRVIKSGVQDPGYYARLWKTISAGRT